MGIIPFHTNMFDTQPAITISKNPFKGFCNLRNLIRNIGAKYATIGKVHLPLKKKRSIKPIKKYRYEKLRFFLFIEFPTNLFGKIPKKYVRSDFCLIGIPLQRQFFISLVRHWRFILLSQFIEDFQTLYKQMKNQLLFLN